jgi:hypothetical protein
MMWKESILFLLLWVTIKRVLLCEFKCANLSAGYMTPMGASNNSEIHCFALS